MSGNRRDPQRQAPPGGRPAASPARAFAHALSLFRAGRLEQAELACRTLAAGWPEESQIHRLLGMVRQSRGAVAEACRHFARATRLAPADADAWSDYGQALTQNGEVAEAAAALRRAVELAPDNALAAHNLGIALSASGQLGEAEAAFRQALALDPRIGGARFHLAHLVYERDRAEAARLLGEASQAMPRFPLARLQLAAVLAETGRPDLAEAQRREALARAPELQATAESHAYFDERGIRRFGSRFTLLRHALENAPAAGLVLEFGVRWGVSARFLAARVERLDGFDSFEGLPEEWLPGEGKGSYSTGGARPALPDNVHLHPGWFEDTLPAFLAAHPEPVRLVHVDCDLYSSTATVLGHLADRLRSGTVIVFDEYHSYPGWREHEYRAFQEFARRRRYTYLGFNLFGRQAAVRLA